MQPYLKSAVSWFSHYRSSIRFVQTVVVRKDKDELLGHKPFEEHHVTVNTCGNLYEKWKKEKKFWKVPDGDLTFNVSYLDTGKEFEGKDNIPVILALHGAPGSYKDFERMTTVLSKRGVRVITPNFPDFTAYKPGIFRHSADEKALYIKDFLKEINVSHIDLLICHSSATFPGLKLCIENKAPTISGLALFNPSTFHTSMRAIQPWLFIRGMVYVSEFSIGLKFLSYFGTTFLKFIKIPVDVENLYNPLLSATVMCYGGIVECRELYWKLSKQRFPIIFAFSENDKLINKELSYKLAYELGVQDPQIFHYNEEGTLIKEGKVCRNVKVMAFEKGSHYVLSKHSEVLNEEILKFLHEYVL